MEPNNDTIVFCVADLRLTLYLFHNHLKRLVNINTIIEASLNNMYCIKCYINKCDMTLNHREFFVFFAFCAFCDCILLQQQHFADWLCVGSAYGD